MLIKRFFHILRCFLLLPHYFLFKLSKKNVRDLIYSDVEVMNRRMGYKNRSVLFYLSYYSYYRVLFYYRLGGLSKYIKWLMPGNSTFIIGAKSIGKRCFVLNHPYCTILNAESIGDDFVICQLTTLGNKQHGRNDLVPIIGNNVSIGANVSIIGDVKVGNNVIIGAGSVVVKNIPDNCIVAGNPAKIIKNIK